MHAIGYTRRSTDRQDESLQQQQARLEEFASRNGMALTDVFSDDAISGSEMSRPGLERLLVAARRPDIDVILIWDRNRLARPKEALDGMQLERQLQKTGKRLIYAANGYEVEHSFASGLLGYVEHHQNGDYLRKLSRDTSRGLVARVKRGLWPGGPIPFGFDRLILDGDTPRRIVRATSDGGQQVLDAVTGATLEVLPKRKLFRKQDHETCSLVPSEPSRVRAVQRLFEDFAAGKPTRQLRDELNEAGFRTSRGQIFTVQTLIPMLENPAYTGRCVYNRRTESKWHKLENGVSVERVDEGLEYRPESDWIVCENAWDALVDVETFEAVQRRRASSKANATHHRGNAMKSAYLLSGVMRCSVCGGKLTGHTTTSGKGYKTRYYVCGRYSAGYKNECPKRYTVPADPVEEHILGLIRSDLERFQSDETFYDEVMAAYERLSGGQEDTRGQVNIRLEELDGELATVREHLLSMDPATAKSLGLYDRAEALVSERVSLERKLAEVSSATPTMPSPVELRGLIRRQFERLEALLGDASVEEKRCLIGEYVQQVEALPERETVRISLYPPGVSQMVAGAGFEPATFGL